MSAFLLITVLLVAAEAPPAPRMEVKGADTALLEEVRVLAERIEAMRGQPFERPPVAVRAPAALWNTSAEIRAFSALQRSQLEARGRAWADIGLGNSASPARLMIALAGDLRGIWLDPEHNRVLVAPERLSARDFDPKEQVDGPSAVLMLTGVRRDEPLLAHQLIHVRQRERAGGDWLGPTTDVLLARAAWAEGEANLVAVRHLFMGLGLEDQVIELSADPADFLEGDLVPPALEPPSATVEALVRFVYLEGFARAVEAFRQGGWKGVDRAMAGAATTRDLLQPGKPRGERAFCDATAASPAPGLALADLDSLGQQGVIALLATLTGKDNLALIGADGWRGDCLYRWEPATGGAGITDWSTHWSSAEAAADFDYAFGRALEARYPGRPVSESIPGRRVLSLSDGVLRVTRDAAAVRIRVAPGALDVPPPSPAE